ncbi:Armadillo-type fold [Arabidopsis suecica]|jgi:26S proteasome regulatory subunit N1|uniref:26S proteasome non-ATPase regulatory subunit 2 homolog B n=2 Tax=Arabidopsis TaxID=3701 RepID=PSD2B_ARATH|nr:26S proteasome regulatory subunit S2 1B [Arabidopsis thaliana]Q6XJG8.1 RecName: Full=26S proteasome non-ATPase regulatory subunit 2 homolog B; AltName: Full=26S proteasome regulatory subunit RPN1b; Short=AtRPN1b; AltName: Full=26S proteasome regulatory subunit S2 homolog B [Arabidopsis thaliana]AAP86656.1 26S proteasome subunit RPN1b [Arabidopsis thaliana]AEE85490.1 26S proteasome regulatory subunit S2 1B [Arabidopsis thaliana]KAG7622129.1 Armadillo-type fold [Arabidopsis suecica]|eukprot:NP_194576.5 26S proteasome regulatory subunit S2 1B [Arabidopsis thaliana]
MAPVPDPNSVGGGAKRDEATTKIPSKDSKKKDDKKEEDLSEEDLQLKQNLELYVERVQDPNPELQKIALESMRKEIRDSTSSMTSVPKPLKFLRPHYGVLKEFHAKMAESDLKKMLADILSVLALTMSAEGERESLNYRLNGSESDIGSWGHEYVRNLAGEIAKEYTIRQGEESSIEDLMDLVQQIVSFHMKHNAETEAVDLLMDVEDLDLLLEHVDNTNFRRTCNYLTSAAKYLPGPDDMLVLDIAYMIYIKFAEYPNALQIALFLDNMQYVKQVFTSCTDLVKKKQFCYMIARHGMTFELDQEMVANDEDKEALQDIVNNSKLSEGYLTLARDIEVMEAKTPEDIYKAHLLDGRASSGPSVDSARQNLSATFVNAFVNAGFGQDKLMTVPSDSTSGSAGNWLFKNKEHGKTSAVASLGMIQLWDVETGLGHLDKYFHSNDNPVVAGALLGVGIVNCGIKNDCDPAFALLSGYIDNEDSSVRIGAIMGLGIAYAGSQNDQIKIRLSPILNDANAPLDVIAFAALSLGMIYVGSCNEEVAQSIIFALMDRSEAELGEALTRFLPLGLGLLYLGKQESVEATAEVSKTFNEKIRKYCDMTLLSCAYAGTGNVLKVQDLLAQCGEHLVKGDIHQGPAVIGLAMVAMSEELGLDMEIRSLERVLQYGEQNIRRAVPLALGLLCISNPKVTVMDTLSRLSHDTDSEVAMAAIISLGLIGAGTNNARIAGMLRNLSSYYYKDASLLFCVRIAQGFVHMGKGLLTLNPFHSERLLLSPTALAGIVTLLHACLDMKSIILGKYHYVLYFLVLAMQPRMMLTVDQSLKPISVPVRVGQAVDVVGQAGRPKTITGFQTHSTPVLLAAGERAELATEKYIPLSPILEGFVILKENPDYREE